tara:strand:- start:22327 stop:23061 length:735 start_codon:yes stop_codon:yes gene_type:complete
MSKIELSFICILTLIWGSWFYRKYVKTFFGTKKRLSWLAQQQQNKKIRSVLVILEKLYQNTNSHRTAKLAKIRRGITEDSFLYGEVDFLTLIALLTYCQPTEHDVFYDLGSGAGKAVFSAALCFPIRKSIGIELMPELVSLAKNILAEYQKTGHAKNNKCEIQFEQADILQRPFSDATIIFINATAFKGQLWKNIEDRLYALPIGARVILTTHQLSSSYFKLIYSGTEVMSWGMNSAFVFEKIK